MTNPPRDLEPFMSLAERRRWPTLTAASREAIIPKLRQRKKEAREARKAQAARERLLAKQQTAPEEIVLPPDLEPFASPAELKRWISLTPTSREALIAKLEQRRRESEEAAEARAAREQRIAEAEAAAKARREAATQWAPHMDEVAVPPGYQVRGTSTLRNADGTVRLQWQKTTTEKMDPYETARQIAAGIATSGLVPLAPIPEPAVRVDDQLCVYPLGDPHIGMYCWAQEVGKSFDLEIARRQYEAVSSILFQRAPEGSPALLIDLGDFYHFDDEKGRTSSGANFMDMDTRYQKVMDYGQEILTSMITTALNRHSYVTVWCLRGNHDNRAAYALQSALIARYRDNPRVIIDPSPDKFRYLEFGVNLLGGAHGDGLKGKRSRTLHEIMTCDQREAWGRTRYAKWFVGHVHHESKTGEDGECVVETYRTLAPKDAWHHTKGYRSGRDTRLEIFHREFGPQTKHIVGIDEIQRAMQETPCDPPKKSTKRKR